MSDDDTPRDDRQEPRDDRQELADLAADLESVLRDLRTEVEPDRRRGPLGLPRPPEPRRVLQFADQVAIPATIAILEANVKLLQALQRAIRLTESGRRVREEGSAMGDRAADVSRTTLDRLGSTLEDLQEATEGGGTPESGPARELIEEARRLRDEIDTRLREAQGTTLEDFQDADEGGREEGAESEAGGTAADSSSGEVPVDVEAELDSLKDQYGEDDADGQGGASDGEDGSEDDGDGPAGDSEGD
ncbi:MAG: hypothetical protein ACI9YT_001131 [Halobacteriales archaeon]|jgi:hypothetical protein